MRVGYGLVCCRRMRFYGDHVVGRLTVEIPQPVRIQGDLEWPQVDIVERDRLGDRAQCHLIQIELYFLELIVQSPKFLGECREARHLFVPPLQ